MFSVLNTYVHLNVIEELCSHLRVIKKVGSKSVLLLVPSHCDLEGNKLADLAAKEAKYHGPHRTY